MLEEEEIFDDDYYAILNIPKDDVVGRSFRQLSRHFHPDRHVDEERKKDADVIFRKIRKAHEVLSNPRTRHIYDTLGVKGLEVQGWELVPHGIWRTKEDIVSEFERLKRLEEDQRLLENTNPTCSVTVSLNATELMRRRTFTRDEFGDLDLVELTGVSLSQTMEAPLSVNNRLLLSGQLEAAGGRGQYALGVGWRRLINQYMWAELHTSYADEQGFESSAKLVRTLGKHTNVSVKPIVHFRLNDTLSWREFFVPVYSGVGLRPGIEIGLTRQLDHRLLGQLTLKLGGFDGSQSVTSSLIFDDNRRRRIVVSLVMAVPRPYLSLTYTYRLSSASADPQLTSLARASLQVGFGYAVCSGHFEKDLSDMTRLSVICRCVLPTPQLSVKFRLKRGYQTYVLDVTLCDEMEYLPQSLVLGVLAPLMIGQLAAYLLRPYVTQWQDKNAVKRRKYRAEVDERRKDEARKTIELMRESAQRVIEKEEKNKGLLIVEAKYGCLVRRTQHRANWMPEQVIDVRIPLQTLVSDSKLLLYDASKSQLPGFYDPCPGDEKQLQIRYKFRGEPHCTTVKDDQPLLIPKRSHRTDF